MARALLEGDAVFRQALLELDAVLSPLQGWSVHALLSGGEIAVDAERPEIAHPAIFAVQYGLTRSLQQRGLEFSVVLGHSAGEVAAAVAAGILTLAHAAQVVAAHSELIAALVPGAMLHVAADAGTVRARIAAAASGVELAAVNSGQAVVVAGAPPAIAALDRSLRAEGIETRRLGIGAPFHTAAVEPHLDRFRARIAGIRPRPALLTVYSSLRGDVAQAGDFSADYWTSHIRRPVAFADAVSVMLAADVGRCIEVSPHPVLLQHIAVIAAARGQTPVLDATLQRDAGIPVWPDQAPASIRYTAKDEVTRALEEALASVLEVPRPWAEVEHLQWPEIGCGSLQLVRLMGLLSTRLQRTLSVTLAYRHATPAALIEALAGRAVAPPAAADPAPVAGDAIAIVGMACRFPGSADHPEALWRMLADGVDPVGEIPPERWPADAYYDADRSAPGRGVSRWGGFIAGQDLREFDARHFRMTPREASALDPQQRLLLEVTWEALENADMRPASLKGKRVGVYVGLSTDDYKNATLYQDIAALDPYAGAGTMSCTAAGRLSYFFGWEGPSLAIDTACSSSLVALHVACQALRSGECDVAVVGGANALLTPHLYVYFSKAGIMSPTGRCHVFDAAADGYVRAEGCGMLVLQSEAAARGAGRRVRARVLGSAINQDGASAGFSAPNGEAQRKVLREAWKQAAVSAAEIGYLEAHGTGTPIGDPIELEAIAEAVAPHRTPADPILVGSLKSNLGHLEAAAGVAALIKTVLSLERAELPANLHLHTPNPHVDWPRLPLRIVDRQQPWPERGGRFIGAVSSFGFSGTNAHAVLERAASAADSAAPRTVQVLALSAPDHETLRAQARQYSARTRGLDAPALADLASTTHLTRPRMPYRVAVAGTSAEVAVALENWAQAPADSDTLFSGAGDCGPIVFAFTGQGCQYPGMAAALYHGEPVFRSVVDRCEAALLALRGSGMLALLLDEGADPEQLAATQTAQPAIYAVQCAIVALLHSWGVRPDRVVGHSVGEFAAAVAAGALSLEDGLALVAQRGQLMAACPAGGAMVSVQVDEATALSAIGPEAANVSLAAVNGPRAVVLSGAAAAIDTVLARLGRPGASARRLVVSHAYHSPAMAAAAEAFARLPAPAFAAAKVTWISSVDGSGWSDRQLDMAYWARQMRSPVRFHDALSVLEQEGCRSFVEIGPAAVLSVLGRDRIAGADRLWIPTQQRRSDGRLAMASALAALAARGAPVDWSAWDDPAGRRRVDLPPYPFQRKRHWREPQLPSSGSGAASPPNGSAYEWLNQHALALLAPVLANVTEVAPRWTRHHASCLALVARVAPGHSSQGRDAFLASHPTLSGCLSLLEDCISHYPAVLAGQIDPLTLLFPGGSMDRVEAVYANNEVQDRFNRQVAEAAANTCAALLAATPQRRLCMLEIGAGTGGTTDRILAALPVGAAVDYFFTDISPAFLSRARRKHPQLVFRLLNVERHPQAQGFDRGMADIVIANNVLHATADIPAALAHVNWLCAPGATLLLNEQTELQPFIHVIFGLTDGWWRFDDALRNNAASPLLDSQAWTQALQQGGFTVDAPRRTAQDGQLVFVAHALKEPDMAGVDFLPGANATAGSQLGVIRAIVCELSGMDPQDVDVEASLLELGLDSLMLVQLKTVLANRTGLDVEMADFYGDLDTVERLAAALAKIAPAPSQAAVAGSSRSHPASAAPQPSGDLLPALPTAAPTGELARLMALQLETVSRLISEQNAILARSPQPAAAVDAAAHTSGTTPATPNFRSLKLDADPLDASQRAFVADLTVRYTARTAASRALADGSRATLADWKNTLSFRYSLKEMMYPIVAARSHGSHFTDLDGNDFLDLTMGCGIALLGHSPACVTQALHAQVDASFAIGPQISLAAEVAQHFARITGMERVTFCNTGAEAVMMAVRIARAVTGRRKLVIFSGAYHGTWDGVLGVEHQGHVHPVGAGIPQGMVDDLVILNYGTDEALSALREHAADVAAVLIEPVQSRRPGVQPVAFLRQLRAITSETGSALIFDEMITGLRIAPGGCQAHFGIQADLATYGKIVGGGMPLSIVAGSARFMDRVDGGSWRYGDASKPESDVIYFGGTYVKHPLALAAAKATLEHIDSRGQQAYDELNARTAGMAQTLNAWFEQERVPLSVAHFGSLFRIDGTGRFSAMMQPVELDLFFLLVNLRSVYVWERRICFLSFAHTDAEVEHVVECVKQAVLELRGGGFPFRSPAPAGSAAPAAARQGAGRGTGPAASAQRRMFALAGIEGPSVVYNVPLAIHLRGPLDVQRLQGALDTLMARHPALRTRFEVLDDALVQVVEPDARAQVERIECPEPQLTVGLESFVRPFDLARAPLLRAGLFRVDPAHHVLLVDAHHIVVDGLSLNILAQELMTAYAGQPLPPAGADMIEYACAEKAYLGSDACARDAAYWRAQFLVLPEPLQLPLDAPRPLHRRHRGADLVARLDATATARLTAAARAHRMPAFPLLLALYATLLHRLSAQDDLVIGLPVGGRSDPRFGGTVGMLAATLPLRMEATPDQTLAECARACHKRFLGALGHAEYPLDALIASLDLPRDTSRNPLFDTMFIYEDGNDRVYRMQGLECAPADVSRHAAMFDLSMEVVEAGGELTLRCEYDTDLFTPASAQGVLDTYVRLLHLAPDRLDLPVAELNLLDAQQRARVLAWGDGGPAPQPATILELFDVHLARAPDALALVAGAQTLTYRELDRQATQLAHALAGTGDIVRDTPVALVAARDAGMLVGMLAILRAGAAYLPIDPSHPLERTRLMLEASGCLLAVAAPAAALPPLPGLRVVQPGDGVKPAPAGAPALLGAEPDHLANLLFTSGSTGQPKGVMVRHRNAAALFSQLPSTLGFAPGDRILAVTTPAFDIAALELIGALCCGMTVVMASEREADDPALLRALIEREQVNVLQMTPSRLRLLTADAGFDGLSAVRTLLVGGEALPPDLAAQLSALKNTEVFNVYGPTETTIWSAFWKLGAGPVSLGRPFPGESLYVLSPQRRLQPAGAVGEIAIGGAGVAAGYIGDPARTAERFVAAPGVEGAVYLTGDLGRWRADGSLEYLGRRDDQVKVRGARIEIGEIEHQLRRLAGVSDAAAAVRENPLGDSQIVAYLVGLASEPDPAALRNALAQHLPPAMIPARFMRIAALPRTANGKTDRRALPRPEPEQTALARREPQGELEIALTAAFAQVLGHAVGPDDDFFLCGGESIRALRLASRIRGLQLAFELRDLFVWPTPARLAANLTPLQAGAASQPGGVGELSGLGRAELEGLLA